MCECVCVSNSKWQFMTSFLPWRKVPESSAQRKRESVWVCAYACMCVCMHAHIYVYRGGRGEGRMYDDKFCVCSFCGV